MLVKCKDCGHDVSSEAGKCPNCGSPVDNPQLKWYQKNSKANVGIMLLSFVFLLACIFIALYVL